MGKHLDDLLESGIPDDETDACDGCDPDSPWNLERCYDTTCNHVQNRTESVSYTHLDVYKRQRCACESYSTVRCPRQYLGAGRGFGAGEGI